MKVSVHLQKVNANGYRATRLEPAATAAGATREEALTRLRQKVSDHLAQGEWLQSDVPTAGERHRLTALAGIWKDAPEIDEYLEAIKEYRREVDADPNR